ncbi:hypothetical protein MXB_3242 [Myxobolus squamalis]|nr:hypothetical protein MXB_3242 [Myxobolus squamalis]
MQLKDSRPQKNPCLNFMLCGDCMSNYKCSWVTDDELLKDKNIHVGARKCVLTDQLSNKNPQKYIYLNSTVLEKTPGFHRSYNISHSGFTLNLRPVGEVKTIEFNVNLYEDNRLDIYALIDISSSKIDFSKSINSDFNFLCRHIIIKFLKIVTHFGVGSFSERINLPKRKNEIKSIMQKAFNISNDMYKSSSPGAMLVALQKVTISSESELRFKPNRGECTKDDPNYFRLCDEDYIHHSVVLESLKSKNIYVYFLSSSENFELYKIISKNLKNQSLGVFEYKANTSSPLTDMIVKITKLKDKVRDYNMHIKNLPVEVDVKSSADWYFS